MKKIYISIMTILISIMMLGCNDNKVSKENLDNREDKIKVYATIFPLYDFARNIGKDKIDLNYIVPPSGEPHDYEISAKMVKDIQNSNVLIKNGLGVDAFVDDVTSESDKLKIVIASDGIKTLKYDEENGSKEEHEEDDVHKHGEYDPHVWLNINNAIKECENIKNILIEVDSENKDYYEENYINYIQSLKDLQKSYDSNLSNVNGKSLLVSHDAYGYLCEEYGLKQISVTGVSPNQEPSISKITEITDYAKSNNIKYILFDGLVNPKVSQTIASEANIDTAILYSIDGITKDDFNNNEGYISLMEKNLETLKTVLK